MVVLNADETGARTANVGFEVNRGTSANVQFVWDESNDRWAIGNSYVAGTLQTTANTTIGGTLITSAAGIRFNDGTTQTSAPLDPIVYAIALG